jgi:protein TonB
MTETGFFAQKNRSPGGLALVLLLHGAVLTAVVMIKSPQFIRDFSGPLVVTPIEVDPDPPPVPPEPQTERRQPVTQIARTEPIVDTQVTRSTVTTTRDPPPIRFAELSADVGPPLLPDPPSAPVRRAAELDPRFAAALQPPYPPSELRAQRSGRVQVRVTIGPDGRVTGVSRLSATSDDFWEVTERQARRWRFRPATVDGRAVQYSMVMTLVFRIEDAT